MRKIPFSPPDLSQAEIDEVIKVLKLGWITTGPETKLFESRIAERCHTEKAGPSFIADLLCRTYSAYSRHRSGR